MLRRKQNTGKKLAAGAALGGILGYIAGILTAPKSGKQTREELANKAGDAKNSAEGQLQSAVDELNEALKTAKGKSMALNAKARAEFDETVVKAKDAQNKASQVLKAFKAGEADNPELNKAVKQAKQAISNLSKYLKS
jgi:gas vesicle protein